MRRRFRRMVNSSKNLIEHSSLLASPAAQSSRLA